MEIESNASPERCPCCGAPTKLPIEKIIVNREGLRHVDVTLDQVVAALTEIIRFKEIDKLYTDLLGSHVLQVLGGWVRKKEGGD
jgi:hypothetical protein